MIDQSEEPVFQSSVSSSTNHLYVPDANCQGKQEVIIEQAEEQFVVWMPSTEKEEVKVREGYLEFSPVDLPPPSSDSEDELPILPIPGLNPSPLSEGV